MGRESVDAKTLVEWLARGEAVTVVDVRRAEDHAEWSVPGSVNLDAYDRLKAGDPEAMEGLAAPAPGNHERILEFNRSGKPPEGDPSELEAGANRCAAG